MAEIGEREEMIMARIPENRKVYLVHFPISGDIYSTGPQKDIPGGPIAYTIREMAQQAADAIAGEISMHCVDDLIEWCLKTHFVLWIRRAGAQTSYVGKTVSATPNTTAIRVEGVEREQLIRVFHQQTVGSEKRGHKGIRKEGDQHD